jgi:hypothetical protein
MKVAALIVDDREAVANKAIREHQKYLPDDWVVIHQKPPYAGGIYYIKTPMVYNNILTNPNFWRGCMYDRVLIFQHDSGLLKSGIEEFLEWDFIGAWIKNIPGCMNGGLSIRNPKVMYEICVKHPYKGMSVHGNEDIYFCNKMMELGYKMPDKETCNKFAVETEFEYGSVGYHAINKYHRNYKLQLDWDSYGDESFNFEIVEETKDLIEKEQFYLDLVVNNCYNVSLKAYNPMSNPETVIKQQASLNASGKRGGQKLSEEQEHNFTTAYHITTEENAEEIDAIGLRPKEGNVYLVVDEGDPKKLRDELSTVAGWIYARTEQSDEELNLLKIDISGIPLNYRDGWYRSLVPISADRIENLGSDPFAGL